MTHKIGNLKKQKRVVKIIKSLKHYINTYNRQIGYLDYSDETIIDDILYGLGTALDANKYSFFEGFRELKNS